MRCFLPSRAKYAYLLVILLVCNYASVIAQSISVKGKVLNEKAEGMPGVSVLVKGTNNGVSTNQDGEFSLKVPNRNTVLVFSSVGYQTQEMAVGNQSNLSIVMKAGEA